jgi:hypothetical protein
MIFSGKNPYFVAPSREGYAIEAGIWL